MLGVFLINVKVKFVKIMLIHIEKKKRLLDMDFLDFTKKKLTLLLSMVLLTYHLYYIDK